MIFRKQFLLTIILSLFTLVSTLTATAQKADAGATAAAPAAGGGDAKKGLELFKANCATCHKLDSKLTGPALKGVEGRWDAAGDFKGATGAQWLRKWIRNTSNVTDAGYGYAVKLKADYNGVQMTAFPLLADADIENLLAYIANPPVDTKTTAGGPTAEVKEGPFSNTLLYVLIVLLILIALILSKVSSNLNRLVAEKNGLPLEAPVPFYKNRKLWALFTLLLVIFIGNATVNGAIDLGRQQGYAPVQPIKFSHKLHAGINKINCQYCHQGATKGKASNIPSANVCMNCHKGIKEQAVNAQYGRKEITKIYAAIGFNPNTGEYIKDYDKMPKAQAEGIFHEWLKGDTAGVNENQEKAVFAQIGKPLEWVRIHNLPDHVYFNHAQHVVVGGVACQTCHGPVETMDVMTQYSPLSMGWCLSCHRNQVVNFTGNDYYKVYAKYQEEVKKDAAEGKPTKVTVEKVGGTECQKCHY